MTLLVSVVLAAFAWIVVAEGHVPTLWGGLVAVPAAIWAGRRLAVGGLRPRLARVPGFVLFFLISSLVGGSRVAWLSIRPRLAIDPDVVVYPLRLPPGPKEVFVTVVNLLPGTLSARIAGDTLYVHALEEAGARRALEQTERRVAVLFGIAGAGSA